MSCVSGFYGGLEGQGPVSGGMATRAGKYDQFGRLIPQAATGSSSMYEYGLGGRANVGNDDSSLTYRPGGYDRFGRPIGPNTDTGPVKAPLLPTPGVAYPRVRNERPSHPGMARVTSAPVGPSKEAMIEDASRPIIKVDKPSSHYPWAMKDPGETPPLMPPPLPPLWPGREEIDQERRNRPAMRLDRPGLGYGDDLASGDRNYDTAVQRRKNEHEKDIPDDRSRWSRKDDRSDTRIGMGRVDVRFEGRGLRDLYQDHDFGRRDERKSSDRRSDSKERGSGRLSRDNDRGRTSERGKERVREGERDRNKERDRVRDAAEKSRNQKPADTRSNNDEKRSKKYSDDFTDSTSKSSRDASDQQKSGDAEEARINERRRQQQNRRTQRANSLQSIGRDDDFDSAWKKVETADTNRDLFGSSSGTEQTQTQTWWSSCTICKMNFRQKGEFKAHVDEPLHYINLEKVRKEYAREKATKKIATINKAANEVESIIYRCKICNISLIGWANFNQHVSSQIHLVHFVKNVGSKGDPKGLEYFDVSDQNAPGAIGRTENISTSLLSQWRSCKGCNLNIPSWERFKLHMRTQQHLDSTVSEMLREIVREETDYIRKNADVGKEKNVEDIEKNRKAFWETQMPLNYIRPSQGQMDDAYHNFLKEAGIESEKKAGFLCETDRSQSQSSPLSRGERGNFHQQSNQGQQSASRRHESDQQRKSDGGSSRDYWQSQETSRSGSRGSSKGKEHPRGKTQTGPPASTPAPSGLSSQGRSVLNLFDKFLGESTSASQGQGEGHQAHKLLDTIKQKLEGIGDVEDDNALNMILDRVVDEYKALKTGGTKTSQPQSSSSASAPRVTAGSQMQDLRQMQMQGRQGTQQQQKSIQHAQMQQQQQRQQLQLQMQGHQRGNVQPAKVGPTQPSVPSLMDISPIRPTQTNQDGFKQPSESNRTEPSQANRNPKRQVTRWESDQDVGQGQPEQRGGKMKAIFAASLAASLVSQQKKKGMSENAQNKLMDVVRSLNEKLTSDDDQRERKRPSRWSSDESRTNNRQESLESPDRKRPRERSPEKRRDGPNQGDRHLESNAGKSSGQVQQRPERRQGGMEQGRNNQGQNVGRPGGPGGPGGPRMKQEPWIGEMNAMHGPNQGGPGGGGPRGPAPFKSLLPPPGHGDMGRMPGPGGMRMPGPRGKGPGMPERGGLNISTERMTALYGDVMNVLAPGSVNSPQEMSIATEMIASLSQAMMCVLNNVYNPESQTKIQQAAQKFKMSCGNHPLVQAFFAATSVPPEVIKFLAMLEPMLLKRLVVVLQQARKDIQHQALQSAVLMEKFMMNSKLR